MCSFDPINRIATLTFYSEYVKIQFCISTGSRLNMLSVFRTSSILMSMFMSHKRNISKTSNAEMNHRRSSSQMKDQPLSNDIFLWVLSALLRQESNVILAFNWQWHVYWSESCICYNHQMKMNKVFLSQRCTASGYYLNGCHLSYFITCEKTPHLQIKYDTYNEARETRKI